MQNLLSKCAWYKQDSIITHISFYDPNSLFGGTIRHDRDISGLEKLEGLKYLDLRKNRLGKLPDLGHLTDLEYLDLSSNYMGGFPIWIKNLRKLKYLSVGVNEIECLPDFIGEFEFTTLKLHKNSIKYIPELNPSIKFLNLYLNKAKFPNISKLVNLEFFSWGVSSLKDISSIMALQNLRWLSLVANQIREIPDDICNWKHIIGMRLHKNKIERLPDNIGNLKTLKQLTLYQNNLKNLPKSFYDLDLEKLNLKYNEFSEVPKVNAKWISV